MRFYFVVAECSRCFVIIVTCTSAMLGEADIVFTGVSLCVSQHVCVSVSTKTEKLLIGN